MTVCDMYLSTNTITTINICHVCVLMCVNVCVDLSSLLRFLLACLFTFLSMSKCPLFTFLLILFSSSIFSPLITSTNLDAVNVTAAYNTRFESLNSLCLVKALNDTVVIPNDSEWFGYYADGSLEVILPYKQTNWYKNDLFGLKTLDSKKHLFFNTTDGDHLKFSTDYLLDLIGIYFVI